MPIALWALPGERTEPAPSSPKLPLAAITTEPALNAASAAVEDALVSDALSWISATITLSSQLTAFSKPSTVSAPPTEQSLP